MRVSIQPGAMQLAAQADAQQPSHWTAHESAQVDPRAPGGDSSVAQPNRQFDDLWLRFVSSVSQFEPHRGGTDADLKQPSAQRLAVTGAGENPQQAGWQPAAVDLSRVVSRYIGETEKNLKQLFARAQLHDSVLLFDEADALFGKRSDVKDSHDRYANLEVGPLLQRLEQSAGLAGLTSNARQDIDPDLLERLRAQAVVPRPPKPAPG